MGSASFILGASQWPQRCVADGLETPSHLPAWLMIQMATVIVGFDCTDDHSQILQPTWKSVGRPIPSRGDNFLQRPLALQHYSELTIRRRWTDNMVAALVPSRIHLHKFWQAYHQATLPQFPTMYDTWGGTSKTLGARGLWKNYPLWRGLVPQPTT